MIHCDHFDRVAAKYDEYWHCENHDRPLLFLTAPAEKQQPMPEFHGTVRERWLDTDFVLRSTRRRMENTFFAGEAYPTAFPNLGPDIFGAYFFGDLEFGNDTSWAINHAQSLDELDLSRLDENNFWWKKTLEMTRAMAEDARGDYLVGITDLHTGMDGLVSMRGPEELCFDLYEDGEQVEALAIELFHRFRDVYTQLSAILREYQRGQSNWMSVYHPEGWYVTSCDFMGMISEDMMKRFVLPELKLELDFLKHSIFHLDGIGALRHLDCLLELSNLNGVQWVPGAGKPGAPHWLDVLRRIQAAGKAIHIDVRVEDLPVMLESLPPEGVLYNVHCASAEDAQALLKLAEDCRPKKIF